MYVADDFRGKIIRLEINPHVLKPHKYLPRGLALFSSLNFQKIRTKNKLKV